MSTLTTRNFGLLSAADRDRVQDAASDLKALKLPESVAEAVLSLLDLAAAGRDATIVSGKYLTSNQAASLLGMSRPLLNKLLDEGRIPFHRNGRDRRIELSDVLAYVQERDRLKQAHVAAAAGYDQRRAARLAELAKSAVDCET